MLAHAQVAADQAIVLRARSARNSSAGVRGSAAEHVLNLQRTAGNAAVAIRVAQVTAAGGNVPVAVPAAQVQRSIAGRIASAGMGRPIDRRAMLHLQRTFETDLSPVRVHNDSEADELSRDVGAVAFTSGHDIFFRSGSYDPASTGGFRTLAHEVTHVVQQSAGLVPGTDRGDGVAVSSPRDEGERQAESKADQAVRGRPAPVQRLKTLGTPAPRLVLQRLTDPLGDDLEVDWTTPNAKVDLADQVGTPLAGGGPLNFQGGDSAAFTVPDRKATAAVTFPVTASWHPKAQPPGPNPTPGPADDCNACKLIEDEAKSNVCAFLFEVLKKGSNIAIAALATVACRGLTGVVLGPDITIIPDSIMKLCKTADIQKVIDELRKLRSTGDSDFEKTVKEVAKVLKDFKVPGVSDTAGIIAAFLQEKDDRLRDLVEKLEALRDKCKKGGGTKPVTATKGNATSTMKTTVFINPDGTVRAVGPGPAQNVSGSGATEESPVRFSQDAIPNGAQIAQVPTIVVSGQDGPKAGRQFTVNVRYGLPPQPVAIDCVPGEFFPFAVAKDRFENELDGQLSIRDWYFGHDPEIRNAAEKGDATVKVTGRASNTGKVEFNRILAEKRGARVRDLIRDFAGSDSHLRVFSTGFLTAKEPGEAGHERRADAQIIGQVPADRAGLMSGGDPCSGHNNENSEEGVTGPQTSPLPGLEGTGSEAL